MVLLLLAAAASDDAPCGADDADEAAKADGDPEPLDTCRSRGGRGGSEEAYLPSSTNVSIPPESPAWCAT